jgi:DNA replication protein DnaC
MATQAVCPKCGGTGFTIVERANVSAAEPCACRFRERAEHAQERTQIPPLYRNATFESFDAWEGELKRVVTDVRTYASDFPAKLKKPGLLLIGEPGTGKTHLAVAAMHRIVARSHEGLFFDYQNLLDRIRSGYDAASNSSDKEAYREALEAEVLLLDDLGAHRVTDWVLDTVTAIITYRCNNQKALIATTNLPDSAAGSTVIQKTPVGVDYRRTLADHIGERARSRLFEMCTVIRMPLVEDYRMRKAKKF